MNSQKSLKLNSDFRRLYSRGKSVASQHLVVYAMKNRDGLSRVGFTVSTKIGHAVIRNSIKRKFREIYRLNLDSLKEGYDMIVVARSSAKNATYQDLEISYLDAIAKLNLLK